MSVELRHLRAFVAAAEELSFSAAAERLHLTQQALSRTVSQLERLLGTRLFERTTRSVALTPQGEAMLPAARRTLAGAQDVVDAVRAPPTRPLRLDISSGGLETGASVVRRLRRDHPEVAIEQVELGVRRGVRLLGDGMLDVVLGRADDLHDPLRGELLRRETVLVGMADHHPLARHAEVPVAALAAVPLLMPSDEAAGEWNDFIETGLREAGVRAQRFPSVTHGSVAAADLVREGDCVVPTMAWSEPPAGVVFRPLVEPALIFPWSMVWRQGAEERADVIAFLTAARELADERGWR